MFVGHCVSTYLTSI